MAHRKLSGFDYKGAPRPWLLPAYPGLTPPGGALIRTLAGQSSVVYGVALSGDGRRAVSAAWDQTLKVWDVNTGREVLTLEGHSDSVYGVALSGTGGAPFPFTGTTR